MSTPAADPTKAQFPMASNRHIEPKASAEEKKADQSERVKAAIISRETGGRIAGGMNGIPGSEFGKKPDAKPVKAKDALRAAIGLPAAEPKADEGSGEGNPDPEGKKAEEQNPEPAAPDPAPQITTEQIADLAAQSAARVTTAMLAKPPAEPEPKEEESDELPEKFAEEAVIYEALEIVHPEKYKDIRKKIIAADKAEKAYIEKWNADNPGQEFDPADDAHSKFYDTVGLNIDPADYRRATAKAVDLVADRKVKDVLGRRDQEVNRNRRITESAGDAERDVAVSTMKLIKGMDEEFEWEGKKPEEITQAIEAINERNPALTIAVEREIPSLRNRIGAAHQLAATAVKYDPNNPDHVSVSRAVASAAKAIASLPANKQLRRGQDGTQKMFVPPERWNSISEADRAKFWTVGVAEVTEMLRLESLESVKKASEELVAVSERIAGKRPQSQKPNIAPNVQQNGSRTESTPLGGDSSRGPIVNKSSGSAQPKTSGVSRFLHNVTGRG